MSDRLRFPTVAANWEHFEKVDIAQNAPDIQRFEMKRAFMAGLSSGLVLALNAHASGDTATEMLKLNAELLTYSTLMHAADTGKQNV